jgi:hypothetical protein
MRRILIGLLAVIGLVGFTAACSDSDDESSTSGGGGGGGGDSAEAFCDDIQALDDRFSEDTEAANDPDQVLEALESLDPPEEIADDFQTVLDANRQAIDDPESTEGLEEAAEAQVRVSTFIQEECGTGSDTSAEQGADESGEG